MSSRCRDLPISKHFIKTKTKTKTNTSNNTNTNTSRQLRYHHQNQHWSNTAKKTTAKTKKQKIMEMQPPPTESTKQQNQKAAYYHLNLLPSLVCRVVPSTTPPKGDSGVNHPPSPRTPATRCCVSKGMLGQWSNDSRQVTNEYIRRSPQPHTPQRSHASCIFLPGQSAPSLRGVGRQ